MQTVTDKHFKTNQSFLPDLICLSICVILILILHIPALSRPWLIYDEKTIIDNSLFPSPLSFFDIIETFKEFGLNFNFISSNVIYSSNSVIRSSPMSLILNTFINFCLKKNAFHYHLFILILHIINTVLVYFIIKFFLDSEHKNLFSHLTLLLLTLLWAIHPLILEAILLSTNFPRLITYNFLFVFLLDFLKNREQNISIKRRIFIPLLFLIPMFSTECIIVFPFVLFIISFQKLFQVKDLRYSLKKSFEYTIPYLTGVLIYLFYFIFSSHIKSSHPLEENQITVLLERIFWLSPQIFFHSFKLVFYPKTLSIDQTLLVHLGKSLFDPYAIFCFIFLALWLLVPFYLFIFKKKLPDLFFISWTFFFMLLPFLHILMPSYLLSAERYLYCPLAFIVFGLAKLLSSNLKFMQMSCLFLSALLVLCFIRSYYRILDWKDNYSFITSAYKSTNNSLFKGIRLGMLAKTITVLEPDKVSESRKHFTESLEYLKKARSENKKLLKSQESLPAVIKSYGLDPKSILTKIAYMEVSSRCLEFNESPKIGINILRPIIKNPDKLDPRIFELYAYLLTLENKYPSAKNTLLKANSLYPHTEFILKELFDLTTKQENNKSEAEKYLMELLNYYPYDISVLTKAHDFYQSQKDPDKTAKYAYLYALRTHSKSAFQQALYLYLYTNNLNKAKKAAYQLSLIDKNDPQSLALINAYLQRAKDKKIN